MTLTDVNVTDELEGLVKADNWGTIGTMAPGAVVELTATYVVNQADVRARSVVNVATAAGEDPNGNPVETDPAEVEVPTEPTPSTPSSSTTIPDEEPPLTELPEEDVPLAPAAPSTDTVTIEDDDVPLAAVPKTGDDSAVWFYLAVLSGTGLLCLAAVELKKSKKN